MLCTIIRSTSGNASIDGYDIIHDPTNVRRHLDIVFQNPTPDTILTGCKKRFRKMLELADLTERSNDLTSTYSGGMRRRLELASGLLYKPAALFLDVPIIGLHPPDERAYLRLHGENGRKRTNNRCSHHPLYGVGGTGLRSGGHH
jgi:ABC-2 type transport system ATP-binding protein